MKSGYDKSKVNGDARGSFAPRVISLLATHGACHVGAEQFDLRLA